MEFFFFPKRKASSHARSACDEASVPLTRDICCHLLFMSKSGGGKMTISRVLELFK